MEESSAPNPAQDLEKKVRLLKKALIKEREEKKSDLQHIENLKKKLSILEFTITEKNNQIQLKTQEKDKIFGELKAKREETEQLGFPQPEKKLSASDLEQQNKKLLEDYHSLKQQNTELQAKHKAVNEEYQEIQKAVQNKDDHLRRLVGELQNSLSAAMRQQENLEKDLADAQFSHHNLTETNERLKKDIQDSKEAYTSAENEIHELTSKIKEKQSEVAMLNEKLAKHGENEAKLSSKLMQYKTELDEAENFYQKYEVIKINNLINHPATITLKRDHTGEFILEVEEKRNKLLYGIRSIDSVFVQSEKRFLIRYLDGDSMEFEVQNADEVVKKIRNFLMHVTKE